MSRFEHLPDGSVHGRLLPGTRTAMVVADRNPSRDLSFSGVLLRVEPAKEAREICDRVVHASTPLVTPDGRVFVERGRPGPQRNDELTIEEATSQPRVVFTAHGYTTHLAGAFGHELIVYFVRPGGAQLLAVDMDSGRSRPLIDLAPFARDFHVDGHFLFYSERAENRQWAVERLDLITDRRERLVTAKDQVLAPHPWKGDLAYNDHGLRLLGAGRVEHREGHDVVAATAGDLAAVLHYSSNLGLPELEVVDAAVVRQIATPPDSHIHVVGFVK